MNVLDFEAKVCSENHTLGLFRYEKEPNDSSNMAVAIGKHVVYSLFRVPVIN